MNFIKEDIKEKFELKEVTNKVIHGDCIKIMKKLPEEIVDMVFIDPPYFLQLPKKKLKRWEVHTEVEGVNDKWDFFSSFEEYDKFIFEILNEVKRLMKLNATIWCIGTYHNIFRIGKIMQDMGFWILNDVIWLKNNPMPNWLGVRFTNATENLIWAVKNKKVRKFTFNKDFARKFGLDGKIGFNIWKIPLCTGVERMKKGRNFIQHKNLKLFLKE